MDFTTEEGAARLASDPALAVDVACWFWSQNRLNELADQDDITKITRRINGGLNGLDDRQAKLSRAKFFLKLA
jgi:putative chitinase